MAGQRLTAAWHSTPGRLTTIMLGLIAIAITFGAVGVYGVVQRNGRVDSVRSSSGPLTVQAQELYRSLSDADATAAAAFLSSGAEPPALRDRYADDIAAASATLVKLSAGVNGSSATGGAKTVQELSGISAELPVYTGLIETARANNRLGYPVGAAYLREASSLMRGTLLQDAASLYDAETARLDDDSAGASGYPWVAVAVGIIALVALYYAQRFIRRRTNRVLNLGVVGAMVALVISLAWLNISWLSLHSHLKSAHSKGSAQVELLSQARITALEARTDEALTLIARGSGGDFEKDFTAAMTKLIGKDGNGGLLNSTYQRASDPGVRDSITATVADLKTWQKVHGTIRGKDDGGHNLDAVALAVGASDTDAPAAFSRVDADLGDGINKANAAFTDESRRAGNAVAGLSIAIAVLTLAGMAAAAWGIQRRIAEYR
jgi:hypothetical protein